MPLAKPWIILPVVLCACAPSAGPAAPAMAEPRPARRAGKDARKIVASPAFAPDGRPCL